MKHFNTRRFFRLSVSTIAIALIASLYSTTILASGNGPVTVYVNVNFRGSSLDAGAGDVSISALRNSSVGNDRISAIRVADGYQVTACSNSNFRGTCNTFTSDVADLRTIGFNDVISSLRIARTTGGTQGPAGPAGPQGPEGPQGPKGDKGHDGADGAQGAAGTQGPQGLAGAPGPQGPAGANGLDGTDGEDGLAGADGDAGEQGPAGDPGPQGEQGPIGPSGPAGIGGCSVVQTTEVIGSFSDQRITAGTLVVTAPECPFPAVRTQTLCQFETISIGNTGGVGEPILFLRQETLDTGCELFFGNATGNGRSVVRAASRCLTTAITCD